jgi:hypothetical protein
MTLGVQRLAWRRPAQWSVQWRPTYSTTSCLTMGVSEEA